MKRIVIDLELPKIIVTKLQTVITFDREVGWRRVKNESCSKRGNESSCQFPKGPERDNSLNSWFDCLGQEEKQ